MHTTPLQVLEARQQARLKEADSTLAKRLAWSKAQCARPAEAKSVFDHVVANTDDQSQVHMAAVCGAQAGCMLLESSRFARLRNSTVST